MEITMVNLLFSMLVTSLLVLASCGEEKKKPAPSADATPTPEPTDSSDASSKEIERLKAKIDELSSSSEPDDNDGWLLVGEPQITKELSVRVDFDDDDFGKRMELTLSECGNIKLLGEYKGETTISNTVISKVGNISEVRFYHPNGEATASSGACKLTANIKIYATSSTEQSKSKKINIKAGSVKLSKAKYSDGTDRPFFALKDNGRVTLTVTTKGISSDEWVSVFLWRKNVDNYRYAGEALSGLRSDNTVRGEVCKGGIVSEENSEELVCEGINRVTNDWMRNIPTTGNYILMIKVEEGLAILETGELEE